MKEQKKKKQTMRYSEHELIAIKNTFSENVEALTTIRNFFLQGELKESENKILDQFRKGDLFNILKKVMLPTLDLEAPLFTLADARYGNCCNIDIRNKTPEEAYPFIQARETYIKYLSDRFTILSGKTVKNETILADLAIPEGKTVEVAYSDWVAWNHLLSYLDGCLKTLIVLAGVKTESVEQTISRLQKDSNQ